jgi:hypothetical protein
MRNNLMSVIIANWELLILALIEISVKIRLKIRFDLQNSLRKSLNVLKGLTDEMKPKIKYKRKG